MFLSLGIIFAILMSAELPMMPHWDIQNPSTHLVQNAVKGALRRQRFSLTYSKVKTRDFSPIRDFVNVVDLGRAHLLAVEYLLKGGSSQVINLGTGRGSSVYEIIKKVQDITGAKFTINQASPRKGEATSLVASIQKAKKILKWNPEHSLADSIKSEILWHQSHPRGWQK